MATSFIASTDAFQGGQTQQSNALAEAQASYEVPGAFEAYEPACSTNDALSATSWFYFDKVLIITTRQLNQTKY